jgi:YD repeat-containing protein
MTDPDMGTWNYTLYDALGNLKTQTDARSCTTNLTYDALNRLTNKSYSGCPTTTAVTYTYDGSNNFRSDPFTSLPPGWTSGGSITYSSNGAHMAGAANWSNYLSLTEYLGEGMVAEFSFQHVTANSSSVFQVNSGVSGQANYRRWGLKIHDNAIYRQSCVGAAPTCEEVWLMSLTANTWYRGQPPSTAWGSSSPKPGR